MKIIGFLILLIGFLVALALGAQNQDLVNFNYLIAKGDIRLSSLLGIFFGVGFILGWLFCGALYFKVKMSNLMLKKQISKQREELENLRIEPVKE